MELSEFIRKAINDICDGVMDAKEDLSKKTVTNYRKVFIGEGNYKQVPYVIIAPLQRENDIVTNNIDFEISTIVKESKEENVAGEFKGGAKIVVMSTDMNIQTNSNNNNIDEKITKIKFSLPVNFSALQKNHP